jgi:succinyl-CoA synthetase beta subunit
MLDQAISDILLHSRKYGWVLEPDAKRILALVGISVPRFKRAVTEEEALAFAEEIGYPVVAKIVSPQMIHKSEYGGVATGIENGTQLREVCSRFRAMEGFAGVLVEETLSGVELIIGGKMDYQFGPVVLFGMGGTKAEIYRDTSVRMAPLTEKDVASMVACLKARPLLTGFRGSEPIHFQELSKMMVAFSHLLMDLEGQFESIDLNPVMCSSRRCVVGDARIMLPVQ